MQLQRNSAVFRGPRFYLEGKTLMWVHEVDGSTRIGPREATNADIEAYPEAHERHLNGWNPAINPNMEQIVEPDGGPPPKEVGQFAKRRAAVLQSEA